MTKRDPRPSKKEPALLVDLLHLSRNLRCAPASAGAAGLAAGGLLSLWAARTDPLISLRSE